MSKRTRTILILQVRIPQPAGKTQEQVLEWARQQLCQPNDGISVSPFSSSETQVRVTARETTYL